MNGHTKCNVCGADYSLHHALTDQCPEDGIEAAPGKKQRWAETVFEPVTAKDEIYAESIAKIADSMSFLVRELQDAHGAAPNVAAEMLLFDWLEQIVKIRQSLNRLKAETKKGS